LPKVLTEWFVRWKDGGGSPERIFNGLASLEGKSNLRTPKGTQANQTFDNQYSNTIS